MSKVAYSFIREVMYMPAVVTLYKTGWGKLYRLRHAAAENLPKRIIGAMIPRLLHVVFWCSKLEIFFDFAFT